MNRSALQYAVTNTRLNAQSNHRVAVIWLEEVTYLGVLCDAPQSLEELGAEHLDAPQVILHGVGQVHEVVEVHGVALHSLEGHSKCGRHP